MYVDALYSSLNKVQGSRMMKTKYQTGQVREVVFTLQENSQSFQPYK